MKYSVKHGVTLKRLLKIGLCVLLALSSGLFLVSADRTEAVSKLTKVGPVSGDNGFPVWYKDEHGVRLQLCLDKDDPYCGFAAGDIPDVTKPISYPSNFPSESFYQRASAEMETGTGEKVVGNFQFEAAFLNEVPQDGDQLVFGRVRFYMFGLKPNAEYTITHPYGVDRIVADPDDKDPENSGEIRYTEDIGAMNGGDFHEALNSRIAPFLKWDPAVEPAAPPGYIGDPNVLHPVVGSPFIDAKTGQPQNVFRVEGPGIAAGPNGTFSPNACTKVEPETGTAAPDPDCIEIKDFTLLGKIADNAGVDIQKAIYSRTSTDGGTIDVFASSEEGEQSIEVSGVGIDPVRMIGANGQCFARVAYSGEVPEITVTNAGDTPVSTKKIKPVDQITATADYNIDNKTLTINAQSSDKAVKPIVTAIGIGELTDGVLVKTDLYYPPSQVTLNSSYGGTITLPVSITGAPFKPIPVTAFAGVSQTVVSGALVTLDGTNSAGPIQSYSWQQIGGISVELSGIDTATPSFIAPQTEGVEELVFQLTVTGEGGPKVSTVTITVLNSAPAPVADAGADQEVEQGSVVNLNGSGSQNAIKYTWTQTAGPAVTLNDANTVTPSFIYPKVFQPVTLELSATGPGGTAKDTVTITTVPDNVSVIRADYRRSKEEWRVEGTSTIVGPGVEITIYIGDPVQNRVIGKTSVDPLGEWVYRGAGPATAANERLTVVSSSGGKTENINVRIR
ncbi:PKD domain-containing protein [Bacillus sp. SCS-153A]|uniref:PKD domain-containing protein n=1 Tax=Rossellomorea sedimentorum TaxID=3115294 RepID=UPI003906CCA7